LKVHGASSAVGSLDVGNGEFHLSGASTLSLTGSAKVVKLATSGASHLKLAEFHVSQCTIDMSGASSASISVRSGKPLTGRLSGACTLEGTVDAAEIKLKLDGSSRAKLKGAAKDVNIRADGASNATMPDLAVDAKSVTVVLSSASSVELRGKADSAELEVHGVGQLKLAGLAIDDAKVELSGSSHATLDVRKSLKYTLTSTSHLEYTGDPQIAPGSTKDRARVNRRR
jgi:hypothetical protein